MKIWIDLANSPHVLFFLPLIREFERRGAQVDCTARDFAQTIGLARLHGLPVTVVGRHGGRSALGKAGAIVRRALDLRRFAQSYRPDLALGHNSYAQAIAVWSLGIPSVTLMDYEHSPANHVSFRLADRILLPQAIPPDAVARYGATPRKVTGYAGFKEQVYLEDFQPDPAEFQGVLPDGLCERYVVVVARPPADFAIYHRFKNPLFDDWLRRASGNPSVRIVLLPRTKEQRASLLAMGLASVIIPDRPLDGANLIHHADLVVSAGGTMNREAAILGVPAYSLFAGRPAAVDRALEALGRMTIVRRESDLARIRLRKRGPAVPLRNPGLGSRIVDSILAATTELAA